MSFVVAGNMGGCECRGTGEEDQAVIDQESLTKVDPEAKKPLTYYSPSAQVDDKSLNAFILRALKACEEGDYDAFRLLFGVAYTPPELEAFRRVWHGVKEIRIKRVFADQDEDDGRERYFAYGRVKYRQPDNRGRLERPFVLMVFKENEEWRMGLPSREVIARIRQAVSQEFPDDFPDLVEGDMSAEFEGSESDRAE